METQEAQRRKTAVRHGIRIGSDGKSFDSTAAGSCIPWTGISEKAEPRILLPETLGNLSL